MVILYKTTVIAIGPFVNVRCSSKKNVAAWPHRLGGIHAQEEGDVENQRGGAWHPPVVNRSYGKRWWKNINMKYRYVCIFIVHK